jgi:hypothetical protein
MKEKPCTRCLDMAKYNIPKFYLKVYNPHKQKDIEHFICFRCIQKILEHELGFSRW